MPIVNKTKNTAAIYNRGREVVKVYDHGKLAWQKQTSIPDYLCFTALEAGQFTLTIKASVGVGNLRYMEWSKDGKTWNHVDNEASVKKSIPVDVAVGDKVYWRGQGANMTASSAAIANCSQFSSTARFDVSGHIMSLLKGDDFLNYQHLTNYDTDGVRNVTFAYLFYGCTTLVNAKDLILPTFTSWYSYIYRALFYGCTNLVTSPMLSSMIGSTGCYYQMFYHCNSLQKAPELCIAILPTACYYGMFQGCSSLTYVKCLATDISATNCINSWLSGVSSTGTFIQAEGVTWPRGASGIPMGWLAYDDGEDIPNDYTPCDYIFNPSSASAAAVAIGTTSGINEPFEVDFQATEIVASDRPVAGYSAADTSVSPKQGSQSYFYLRVNPDSFQHQIYRLNTSGDTPTSTNGLLKNGRDLDRHTAKVTYTYNESTGHYLRNLYFDGVLTHSSTTVHPTPLIGTEFYVFGFSSSSSRFINGKIYGLRWWEEDEVTLKANLIPCSRNSDGAAGFWDTAQKQFFTSTYWTAHNDNE